MKKLLLFVALAGLQLSIKAQTIITWTGTISSDWNTPGNWDAYAVPSATDSAIIPNPSLSITNWPKLGSNITVAKLAMYSGSRLDMNGHSVTASGYISINGAIFNNSNTTADMVFNLPGNNENDFYNSTINSNISFAITGNGNLYESANHFVGNANFNIGGTGAITLGYGAASHYDGNLNFIRTAPGGSSIFQSGVSTVGGNFSFSNTGGGSSNIGYLGNTTSIAGTANISSNGANNFAIYNLTNHTPGGNISIQNQNIGSITIYNDTLLVSSLSISGLKNGCTFGNSKISGTCSLADDASNSGGLYNTIYLIGNYFGGNFTATINGSETFQEGYSTGNYFAGDVTFNINGTGSFFTAYQAASQYDGNLSITRTAAGASTIFRNGASTVGGNFSFSGVGGTANLGNLLNKTGIAGMVNISNTGADGFNLYGLANTTTGGNITTNTTGVVNVQSDTLLIEKISLKGLSGIGGASTISLNKITADSINVSDNAAATSETVRWGSNLFNGNFTATIQSTAAANESYGGGNHYAGNAAFNHSGSGTLTIGYNNQYPQFDKDFSLNEATYNLTLIRGAVFGGTSNGHIIQSGAQAIVLQNGSINKAGGATLTLNDSVAVATNFNFVNGNVMTSANKELIFGYGSTATNASIGSHVVGPVSKVGNNAFTFPIGTATSLNTAAISIPVPNTSFPFANRFRAQYFQSNPAAAGYDTALHANTVVKISGCEYWEVQRVSGTNNVSVTLGFSNPCTNIGSGYIGDPSMLRLMHWNGSLWEDLGNGGTSGTTANGTLTTATQVTNFSPFGIGTTDMGANPLPLRLISFTGIRQNSTNILQWATANEQNTQTFEVQRSSDGGNFNTIGTVAATGNGNNSYYFTDTHMISGDDFYRLKMMDIDGKSTYSNILKLSGQQTGQPSVYPNPTTGTIVFCAEDNKLINTKVSLTDLTGRSLQNTRVTGYNQTLSLDKYPAGIYLLQWANGAVMKVLKQ